MAITSQMKTLIDNLKTIFETAITNGDIEIVVGGVAKTITVHKGINDDPSQVPIGNFPYIAISDAGERKEQNDGNDTMNHFFSVLIELASFEGDIESSLDQILDLTAQVEAQIELDANRQLDGHIWAINIVPFQWDTEDGFFFRGRVVTVDFQKIEFTANQR